MADDEGLLLTRFPNVERHYSASASSTLFSETTFRSLSVVDETGTPRIQPQYSGTDTVRGKSASVDDFEIASMHPARQGRTWRRPLLPLYLRSRYRRTQQLNLAGWRFGVALGFWSSAIVLVCNLVFLAVGSSKVSTTRGMGIVSSGTSSDIAWTGTLYHILINTFGTILLSASNYCMQIATAPTREQADVAHRAGDFVDIGVLSVHNLRYVGSLRRTLFWILAFSSLPLHLFYNSVISDVIGGRPFTVTTLSDADLGTFNAKQSGNFHQLTNEQWSGTYRTNPVSQYGDLYLFADAYSFGINYNLTTRALSLNQVAQKPVDIQPHSIQFWQLPQGQLILSLTNYSFYQDFQVGGESITNEFVLPNVSLPSAFSPDYRNTSGFLQSSQFSLADSGWLYFDNVTVHVKAAMAEEILDGSKVEISLVFTAIVIACNIGKVCAMGILLWRWRATPLATIGDGVASFLKTSDPVTVGYCVATKKSILRSIKNRKRDEANNLGEVETELTWSSSKFQLRKSMSRRRASVYLGILLTILWSTLACLIAAFLRQPHRNNWQWGTSSSLTLEVTSSAFDAKNVLITTWLANSPQILLSAAYFFTNSLLTTMYSAYEWNGYAAQRKTLRVSMPEGNQRSQYFLQLPYRIAVPLIVFSGVLHWLLSESLFLRRIEFRDKTGTIIPDASLCACGYSPLSLLVFAIVAFSGSVAIYITSFLRFKQKIPFGANCSLIISAACHPPPNDVDPHLKPLQWGVVQSRFTSSETDINHCAITAEAVTEPEISRLYA